MPPQDANPKPSFGGFGLSRLGISESQYLSCVNRVEQVFHRQWAEKEHERWKSEGEGHVESHLMPTPVMWLRYHPVAFLYKPISGGWHPISNIVKLGSALRPLELLPKKDHNRFVERLRLTKDLSEYRGALFELEVLEKFLERGFQLLGSHELSGVDWALLNPPHQVFLEATHLGPSETTDKVTRAVLFGNQSVEHCERRSPAEEIRDRMQQRLADKVGQLSRNPKTYCAVDLRSLAPPVAEWGGENNFAAWSGILKAVRSVAIDFMSTNASVEGFFIWISQTDGLSPSSDEIVLVRSENMPDQGESHQSFPFVKLTNDLSWFQDTGADN